MTKKLEKELALLETLLSNYKENLANYFDNPSIYDKLIGELLPIIQEKIKLLNNTNYIDYFTVGFHIEPESEPGIMLEGPKLTYYINNHDCDIDVGVKAVVGSTYLLSDYKFKDYDEYKEL